MRKVGDKGVTCFDVRSVASLPQCQASRLKACSPNGQLLAFGSSDYTVGILDAKTLAVSSWSCFRSSFAELHH